MASPTKRKNWTPVVKEKPIFVSRKISVKIKKGTSGYISFQGKEEKVSVTNTTKTLLTNIGVSLSKIKEDKLLRYAERLQEAYKWYEGNETRDQGPTTNEIKTALRDMKNKADALEKSMRELDARSKQHLTLSLGGGWGFFDHTWDCVGRVADATNKAINELSKSSRGARRRSAQRLLINNHLYPIYKEITKKDPFKTSSRQMIAIFYDFVAEYLKKIERPAQSRRALITALSRIKKTAPKKKHS